MKQPHLFAWIRVSSITLALAILAVGTAPVGARADDQQGASSHNIRLVGINDLQARSTYQPTLHKYPQPVHPLRWASCVGPPRRGFAAKRTTPTLVQSPDRQ